MAQPDLEKFVRRGLALKIQPTPGTPETPSTANDGVLLYNGQSGTEFDSVEENQDRPHFTGNPFVVTNKRAFISGEFRLYPPDVPGDAGDGIPSCDILLRPGGMTRVLDAAGRTTRYNPISTGIPLTTGHWWHAGTFKEVYDARHGLSGIALEVGQRFKGQVRIQGSYENVTEDALPTITVPDETGPVVSAKTGRARVSVNGGAELTLWGKSLSVDFGSDLKTKEYTSHKENSIDNRQGTWTCRIAKTDLDDFNPWAVRDANSTVEIDLRVKADDGRYAMLGIRGQISGVNEVDIEGDYGWELSGPCIASSAGGDELFIEFGDVSLALTGELSDGQEGVVYSGTTSLTAIGEYTAPLAWSISAGALPTGLSINAGTGVVSGTPSAQGQYTFTVQAVSADGQTATREQTVDIAAP
jgi:hypothetical protein